jgi:Flp pilus assembly protein TadG
MAFTKFNRRSPSNEKGAAAVEFAIILPLLLLLILLMIDFGRLLFVEISLNSASREAARGSSLAMSDSQVTNLVLDSAPGVAALAALGSSPLVVNIQSCSPSVSNETTTVSVHANFQWITPIELVQIFDPNSTLIDGSGLGMDVYGRGQMLCSES